MENLRWNAAALRALLPPGCELMPVVKANAYGHGAVPIARELSRIGIGAFCAATVQEGVELRHNGIRGDILILGYTAPEDFEALRAYDLIQTVVDGEYARRLRAYGKKLRVHLKADTGMHRLGIWHLHTEQFLRIFGYDNLAIEGLYTHLCAVDTQDQRAYTDRQVRRFDRLIRALRAHGVPPLKLHMQSSYGVLSLPEVRCDYARTGIALYGVLSHAGDTQRHAVPLRPVLSLRARIERVQTLSSGEPAGYGLQFTAHRETTIAVIAIGYADGLPRALSCGVGAVLIRGKRAPIAGRVCMDRCTVDVTGISGVRQGDIAVIIGQDGGKTLSACDIASQTASISNEVLSRLSVRLPRIEC